MDQNRKPKVSAPPGFENQEANGAALTFEEDIDTKKEYKFENAWCFWHDKFIGGKTVEEYEASLQFLCTFSTIEDFWKCFNNLPPVDQLKLKSSFHLMKEGIKPIWEDPQNAAGGFWVTRIKKESTVYVWKELVLAIIGEQFQEYLEPGDSICGLTVSIRQYDNLIRLWTQSAERKNEKTLNRLKELIPDAEAKAPFYKANAEHLDFAGGRQTG